MPVAVWQPCELIYTLVTYLLTPGHLQLFSRGCAYGYATVRSHLNPTLSQPAGGFDRPRYVTSSRQQGRYKEDVSYASIVLWVETIRLPRAEGGGPLGGADVCNNAGADFSTSTISCKSHSIEADKIHISY